MVGEEEEEGGCFRDVSFPACLCCGCLMTRGFLAPPAMITFCVSISSRPPLLSNQSQADRPCSSWQLNFLSLAAVVHLIVVINADYFFFFKCLK